jgi:hypothetical protein
MIRHVVLFRFLPDTTDEQKTAIVEGLRALPPQIPELLAYDVGPDLGLTDGTFDLGVVADFADAAGYRAYLAHDAHETVARERIRPFVAERASVQFEIADR